jgi:hypothetical protein
MLAYHFIAPDFKCRFDGKQTAVGETLTCKGKLVLCQNGLHASIDALDALQHAAYGQTMLCLVELSGTVVQGEDKCCARNRKILKAFDATKLLQQFAIECAEDALPLFEQKYPDDARPRKAIAATKQHLANPTEENRADAATYAARAADAAARAAADARAAVAAARAAARADAAARAADAAVAAAYAAVAAADARTADAAVYAARAARAATYAARAADARTADAAKYIRRFQELVDAEFAKPEGEA